MLTYVGRQWDGPLTRAQGEADAADALRIAARLRLRRRVPALPRRRAADVRERARQDRGVRARVVRRGGRGGRPAGRLREPGHVQGDGGRARSPPPSPGSRAGCRHGASPHDPHRITSMPDDLWSGPGSARGSTRASSTASRAACSASTSTSTSPIPDASRRRPAASTAGAGARSLRRGDRGDAVERLTRRLAYVRLLDRPRRTFDRETEAAVARFQREHGLEPSGRYGPRTTRRLANAVAAERERRGHAAAGDEPADADRRGRPRGRPPRGRRHGAADHLRAAAPRRARAGARRAGGMRRPRCCSGSSGCSSGSRPTSRSARRPARPAGGLGPPPTERARTSTGRGDAAETAVVTEMAPLPAPPREGRPAGPGAGLGRAGRPGGRSDARSRG